MEQNHFEQVGDVVIEAPIASDEGNEPIVPTRDDVNVETDVTTSEESKFNESLKEKTDVEKSSEKDDYIESTENDSSTQDNNNSTIDLAKIETLLLELSKRFENKILVDEHKNALFDKMYNELQSYKTDIYSKILKPFVLSTITLIDDTKSFLSKLGENDSQKAENYLRGITEDLIDILEINGVDIYEEETDVFNPRTQKAVKIVPTDNPDLDKLIACRVRKGYSWQGVVLRPEWIHLYKYSDK